MKATRQYFLLVLAVQAVQNDTKLCTRWSPNVEVQTSGAAESGAQN